MSLLNLLVLVWLLITGAGLIYGVRLVRRALRARTWLKENFLNGYRLIVANGAIHRGQIRVFIFADMVLMGVDAAAIQFFPMESEIRHVLSAAFRLLFILMALAFTYKSYLEDHELDLLVNEDQRRTLRTRKTDHEVTDG